MEARGESGCFLPAAPGLWWMSSLGCPSPPPRSPCTKSSAPSQPAARRRKAFTSQSVSRASPSCPSSKVGAVPCSPSLCPPPNPGLWPQDPPAFNSRLSLRSGPLVTNLTYTLQLDGHRVRSRGLFPGGKRELHGNIAVTQVESCIPFQFHFPVREPARLHQEVRGG